MMLSLISEYPLRPGKSFVFYNTDVGGVVQCSCICRRSGDGVFRRGILIPSGGTTLINHAYATVKAWPRCEFCPV